MKTGPVVVAAIALLVVWQYNRYKGTATLGPIVPVSNGDGTVVTPPLQTYDPSVQQPYSPAGNTPEQENAILCGEGGVLAGSASCMAIGRG